MARQTSNGRRISSGRTPSSGAATLDSEQTVLGHLGRRKSDLFDLVPVPVVVMDRDHKILYLNQAAAQAAGKATERCVGARFWDLFDNSACRAGTCAASHAVNTGKVCTGEAEPVVQGKQITVRVTAAPVFDEQHQVLGVVEVIYPLGVETEALGEIYALSRAVEDGQLSKRIVADRFEGTYRRLIEGMNGVLDAVTGPLSLAAEYVERIAKGDLPPKITDTYCGDFNEIKNSLNALIDVVQLRNDDIDALIEAAVAGKLDVRADLTKHSGYSGKMLGQINKVLDAVIGPLNVAAEYVDRIAKGDIPPKITETFAGNFDTIKTNLNTCIDVLNTLLKASAEMYQAQKAGDIDAFIALEEFQGAYRQMASNVNEAARLHIKNILKFLEIVGAYAEGDFSMVLERLPGKQVVANQRMDLLRGNLTGLIAETTSLTRAAAEGQLATRADVSKFSGDFRAIVEGFNQTLDSVVGPLHAASGVLSRIAAKDLKARVDGDYQGDYAKLKEDINKMASDLQDSLRSFSQDTQTLSSASDELSAVSQQMAGNAQETATQASVVSAASEQISNNVSSVASASEEMQASIREIAKNANESARVAKNAVSAAHSTNETVKKLGESSQEIGNVIKVITSIAQQTNLLALNATIEAARAGEAGKGFAVVANEVKELAKQTAKATEEIGQKIEAIQGDTKSSVKAIEEIGNIINQINDISNSIASAVEEQTVTTNEIGRSVTEAAKGVGDIAKNIGGVATAAKNTTQGANDTQKASQELSRMAGHLQAIVSQFSI